MWKRILIAILIASAPAVSSAGIMADMNSMFMSNMTPPTNLTNKDRTGVFGGSFYMRMPIHPVNIVSFDPPRMDAGCGGVDLYGGSFTFISGSALVALFRTVASQAAGLAFKAAIDAMVPSLGKLMTEFQTLLQRMNNLAKNSCALAHMVIDESSKIMGSATSGDTQTSAVQHNVISDWASGLADYNNDPKSFMNKLAHLNPRAGNGNMKALKSTGTSEILGTLGLANPDGSADDSTDPNSLNNRLLISMLGYEITGVSCQNQNDAGTADGVVPPANATTAAEPLSGLVCKGVPTVHLKNLIDGGGPNSNSPESPFLLYKCLDPNGSAATNSTDSQICTQMQASNYNYQGIKAYVTNMLLGQTNTSLGGNPAPGSIVGDYLLNASFTPTPAQLAFIRQSGVPIYGLLGKTKDVNVQTEIALKLSDYITSCIAGKVGEALYKAGNGINKSTGYQISTDSKQYLERLMADYKDEQQTCIKREAILKLQDGLLKNIQLAR